VVKVWVLAENGGLVALVVPAGTVPVPPTPVAPAGGVPDDHVAPPVVEY
jgi:hypothetical protein